MNTALNRRLETLERRAGMDDEQRIIIVRFVKDADSDELETLTHRETGQSWTRSDGEIEEVFMARVRAGLPRSGNLLLFSHSS